MAVEKWLIEGEKIIDIDMVRKLKVGLIGGKVDIIGHDEPSARVEVHSVSSKPLKVSIDGDTLEVDHPQLKWDNFIDVFKSFNNNARADVSIMVPRDVALKFGVVSATGLISGLTEDAKISTVSGDVVIDNVYGDLELGSVSGEINVRNHYGNITSKSVSGDITASGEIMKFTSGGVSGDVFLDVTGTPDSATIKTVSGDITLRLEAGVPAQYRISSVSGRLQLDDTGISGVRGQYTGKYGDLHGQWLEFSAKTVSGNVSVLHAAEHGGSGR
ncbi:DUF4097 and DUF4098 domain-containing protein YvlB [Cryobacterium mesophilum]|uniref:DUF4097 domain-containing protein n=1 Tax=Terrimesophilobacter mesophilus TaxID=433647 RepID=A0A4R8VBI0_9MICO|nr:DUF4097 family beta strand repeat-containing protein [Terrimesophilobacter mesophilus]MBB5633241.1 DUF4097 and DUF4098 domain-containing protein YvlB [Terrimesophilobacter mesophilus]TFB79985.1 hypothetical protein E3N84_07960 [Terrimesophilobacter mesophilus]